MGPQRIVKLFHCNCFYGALVDANAAVDAAIGVYDRFAIGHFDGF
jgi:hypothetical protein